jgi:hypothetical protein
MQCLASPGRRRCGHATASGAVSAALLDPISWTNRSHDPSSRGRQRHVSTLTGCLTTADLHRSWVERGPWIGACWLCDKANGENAACSARAHWSRLKIATDVVSVIESAVPETSPASSCIETLNQA